MLLYIQRVGDSPLLRETKGNENGKVHYSREAERLLEQKEGDDVLSIRERRWPECLPGKVVRFRLERGG